MEIITSSELVPQGVRQKSKVLWNGLFRNFKWLLYLRRDVLVFTVLFGAQYKQSRIDSEQFDQYVDATPMILVAGICFMVLRFIGRGTDDRTLYLISGIGGVVFMGFSRMFYNPHSALQLVTQIRV